MDREQSEAITSSQIGTHGKSGHDAGVAVGAGTIPLRARVLRESGPAVVIGVLGAVWFAIDGLPRWLTGVVWAGLGLVVMVAVTWMADWWLDRHRVARSRGHSQRCPGGCGHGSAAGQVPDVDAAREDPDHR